MDTGALWLIKPRWLATTTLTIYSTAATERSPWKGTAMRFALVLSLAMLTITGVLRGQKPESTNANAEIEKEILKIDDQKDHAMQRYVASHGEAGGLELDQIYADDLVFVNTHGGLLTKAQRLEDL